jgi:hypothetical protein
LQYLGHLYVGWRPFTFVPILAYCQRISHLGGIVRSRTVLGVLVALITAAATACTSSTDHHPAPSATPSTAVHHTTGTPGTTSAASASPQQRKAQLEQLYGEHALLASRLMRGIVSASDDFTRAATASLQRNADALSGEVAAAYGSAREDQFRQVWQHHNDGLIAYANAVADGNATAKQEARKNLIAGCGVYGSWIAAASKGRVKADHATGVMRVHTEDLMRQVDAYAAHDYGQAYLLERTAYEQMYPAGATVAKGSVSPQVAASLEAPPQKLRAAFGMLLGEHMELVIGAQRATFIGPEEFKAAGAQVNQNTAALARAMGAIVGPHEGAEFQEAWAEHVEGLMDYSAALAAKDDAAKARAQKDMNTYAVDLAVYFSKLAPKQLDFVSLTRAITAHDEHVVNQINAYAGGNYDQALQVESAGYRQMLGVSNVLIRAIEFKVATGLPIGGSKTGGGGAAGRAR